MRKFYKIFLTFIIISEIFAKDFKIVSLGPYITKTIYLLGCGDKIVANTVYCIYPDDAKNKIKVGDLINIDIEKIYKLKPDIIFGTPLTNPNYIKRLKELGMKTLIIEQPKNFEEMKEQFLLIASILERKNFALKIIKEIEEKIGKLLKEAKYKNKPKVFVQIGSEPLFTATKDSFINDFIKKAGGINIAENSPSGLYSIENVIKFNPDIIIISIEGNFEIEKEKWKKFKNINAVKNNRIYFIDDYKLCSPTIVEFVETLKTLIEIFKNE
jgi:iron complex transport system substrate-binding protein